MMHPMSHVTRLVLAALLVCMLSVPAAFAHAQLLSADPADNTIVPTAPDAVRLSFNEPVSALAITLVGPDGAQRDLTDQAQNGDTLVVPLPAGLPQGTQLLSWRIVSLDGHPVAGALVFSIGASTGAAPALPAADDAVSIALWASRALTYAALFFGVGGAVFGLFVILTPPARRMTLLLCGAGLVAVPLSLCLQGLDALGLPLSAALQAAPWATGWHTSFGPTVLVLELAFLAALLSLRAPGWRRAGMLAWMLAALGPALSGHASAADPQWLTRPAVALHVAALLFWIGALVPLLLALRGGNEAGLNRFSRVVPFAILALLMSGIVLAVVQMGPPGPAWKTPYGYILAGKLALVAGLFALAAWNRFSLTGPALAGSVEARRHLRLSIRAETVLVVVVLCLVAGWRFTPPPRALALAPPPVAAPLYLHAMTGQAMANIALTPGRAGPVSLTIDITDGNGAPVAPLSVEVLAAAPDRGIEAIRRDARSEAGLWQVDDLTLPVPGAWHLTLDIRLDRFSLVQLDTDLDLPASSTQGEK